MLLRWPRRDNEGGLLGRWGSWREAAVAVASAGALRDRGDINSLTFGSLIPQGLHTDTERETERGRERGREEEKESGG